MMTLKERIEAAQRLVDVYLAIADDETLPLLERARADVEAAHFNLVACGGLAEFILQIPNPEDVEETGLEPEEIAVEEGKPQG